MKTQYYTASSLDGFIAAPGDDLSWLFQFDPPPDMGYDAFIANVGAIAMGSHTYEWIRRELVKGGAETSPEVLDKAPDPRSGTLSSSSNPPVPSDPPERSDPSERSDSSDLSDVAYAPTPSTATELPLPTGVPQPWPYAQPTWVFTSRDLPLIPGADIRFTRGDVLTVHRAMLDAIGGPDAGKNIWIAGGGDLVGQFHDAGLLDELIIQVASVTLGAGAPLLPRAIVTPPLRLTQVRQFGEAFVELRYEIAGISAKTGAPT